MNPHHRHGSALAHDTAGSEGGPGTPRRSIGRSSHTPRGERYGDRPGRPGTLPPVPGRLPFAAALAALGALLFTLLTWQVAADGPLVAPDRRTLRWFQDAAAAYPAFTTTARTLCDLGNIQVAVPALLVALCLSARLGRVVALPRWWLPPLAGLLAMSAVPVVVSLVKSGVGRPAPGKIHSGPTGYGFFPSGHTATSTVAYGAAALLLLPWLRRRAARLLLLTGTAVVVLAVGFSLVWCDYHWPLDVLGSWCLALTLLSGVGWATGASGGPGRRE
ncbi:phosphatase PAP2 family protein [Streptomyces sp.]|uniref:phosphatase PAP2 family protein n=1 Tax=Streptomyces sp. TaxID=1931 RepID=UPI002F41237D